MKPIYYVEWEDSTTRIGWRLDEDHKPDLIVSAGFLLEKTRTQVTLAVSVGENGTVLDALCIPRKVITKIVRVQ